MSPASYLTMPSFSVVLITDNHLQRHRARKQSELRNKRCNVTKSEINRRKPILKKGKKLMRKENFRAVLTTVVYSKAETLPTTTSIVIPRSKMAAAIKFTEARATVASIDATLLIILMLDGFLASHNCG